MRQKIILILLVVMFSLNFGCVPKHYRVNPEFATLSKEIEHPILAHPKIKVYELTAGGVRELKQEWCDIGLENVTGAVLQNLKGIKCQIMGEKLAPELEEKIEDLRALYKAVSYSIHMHAMNEQNNPNVFSTKIANFDYSIGPIDDILNEIEADGIILVYGSDEISTGGRQALMAAGLIVGGITGTYAGPRGGITSVNASIINRDGKIIWYSSKVSSGNADLRNKESVDKIIQQLFADFPRLGS
jgi:hypothetical protein